MKIPFSVRVILFIIAMIISLCLLFTDFILYYMDDGEYVLKTKNMSDEDKEYVYNLLDSEIDINIPQNAKGVKIVYSSIFHRNYYTVYYWKDGIYKIKSSSTDQNLIELNNYITKKGYIERQSTSYIIINVIIQIILPIITIAYMIKGTKDN